MTAVVGLRGHAIEKKTLKLVLLVVVVVVKLVVVVAKLALNEPK